MAVAGRAYIVREDNPNNPNNPNNPDSASTDRGSVDRLYPYTLKGLTDALEEARFRSFAGPPHVVAVAADSGIKVIRTYERGHEIPGTAPPV